MKHSELPFKVERLNKINPDILHITNLEGDYENEIATIFSKENAEADAEFIVRACNNHKLLLDALEDLIETVPKQLEDADWWNDNLTDAMNKAKQAIINAEK